MAAEHSLTEMQDKLRQTQAEFIQMFDSADDAALYLIHDADNWSLSVMLSHLIESRTFNTAAAANAAKNPGAKVGRSLDDERRMDAITSAQKNQPPRESLRQRLIDSHEGIMRLLSSLKDADLATPVNHARLGPITLGEFIQTTFVSHDQAHVAQAKAFLQPDSQ